MKKKIIAWMLMGLVVLTPASTIYATSTDAEVSEEAADAGEETAEADGDEAEAGEDTAETASAPAVSGDLVEAPAIDLSLHQEESGDFTPVYTYENPFKGTDTSKGVTFEFYARPTWEVHELGAIFAIMGSGDYDGRLYFSPGSYLGFNSAAFGGYYDANLFNYTLVNDYIKNGALMRIELSPTGFAVYADDQLCYDQTILDDPNAGAGDFTSSSDFAPVLEWLAGADTLYFGYGSWWNAVGSNEANIELSKVNFRLADGTVVMDKIMADKALIESLGGTLEAPEEQGPEAVSISDVDVEIFDIDSVEYHGRSVLPVMVILVIITAVLVVGTVIYTCKPREFK